MRRTPPGTKALIKEYLRLQKKEEFWGALSYQEEISKRVGPGNAVLLDGKIICAHKGEIKQGEISYWISIKERIGLDDQDETIPLVEIPFDNIKDNENGHTIP